MVVLRYFDCRSRGQALRFALGDTGVAFRDERVPVDGLDAFRREAGRPEVGGPFGSLPILHWENETIAQTLAVAGYLTEKLWPDLTPHPAERAFDAMITSAAHLDMQVPFSQLLWTPADCTTEELRARAELLLGLLEVKTRQMERLLTTRLRAGPFFGDSEPRMADYFAYEALSRACDVFGGAYAAILASAPRLQGLKSEMESRENVRALLDAGGVPLRVTASPSEPSLRERLRDLALR